VIIRVVEEPTAFMDAVGSSEAESLVVLQFISRSLYITAIHISALVLPSQALHLLYLSLYILFLS
jgi:hypothetical protein